jgi:hypothetical protein
MPFDLCCRDCWNHGQSDGISGDCRALPPSHDVSPPSSSTVVMIYAPVTVMAYIRTADDYPACGLFKPLVEPEPPVAETKAERIERLRREGVTDLAAFKRALEGR